VIQSKIKTEKYKNAYGYRFGKATVAVHHVEYPVAGPCIPEHAIEIGE